jgi:hypothetical protein
MSFSLKAFTGFVVNRHLWPQGFYGNPSLESSVCSAVDICHPAAANNRVYPVTASEKKFSPDY